MSEEKVMYEAYSKSFKGMSKQISDSACPASWRDMFIFNDESGRAHVVPSMCVVLSEVGSSEWVFRTICGDFKPISNGPILEMVMDGIREFAVVPTTYQIELQRI